MLVFVSGITKTIEIGLLYNERKLMLVFVSRITKTIEIGLFSQ
jgi:hypothetical protein